jgi:hypothetical protein
LILRLEFSPVLCGMAATNREECEGSLSDETDSKLDGAGCYGTINVTLWVMVIHGV